MSLKIGEDRGRKLLQSMGFVSKKVLAVPEKIQERLRGLYQMPEDTYKTPEDPEDAALLKSVLKAKEEVDVVPEGKNGGSEKGAKKAPAAKAPGGSKDRFGCRIGGEPARINAVLTRRPQTAEQIAERVGLTPERVNWQLKYYQREKGYVRLTDKGWALVG